MSNCHSYEWKNYFGTVKKWEAAQGQILDIQTKGRVLQSIKHTVTAKGDTYEWTGVMNKWLAYDDGGQLTNAHSFKHTNSDGEIFEYRQPLARYCKTILER